MFNHNFRMNFPVLRLCFRFKCKLLFSMCMVFLHSLLFIANIELKKLPKRVWWGLFVCGCEWKWVSEYVWWINDTTWRNKVQFVVLVHVSSSHLLLRHILWFCSENPLQAHNRARGCTRCGCWILSFQLSCNQNRCTDTNSKLDATWQISLLELCTIHIHYFCGVVRVY